METYRGTYITVIYVIYSSQSTQNNNNTDLSKKVQSHHGRNKVNKVFSNFFLKKLSANQMTDLCLKCRQVALPLELSEDEPEQRNRGMHSQGTVSLTHTLALVICKALSLLHTEEFSKGVGMREK